MERVSTHIDRVIGATLPLEDVWGPFLTRISAFYPLRPEVEAGLRRVLTGPLQAPPRSDLRKSDGHHDGLLILASGFAHSYRLLENGRRQIMRILVPGDICDYGFLSGIAATTGGDRIMSFGSARVGRIDVAHLIVLCETHPELMRAILRASAVSHASMEECVISLGSRTAIERVGHFLCEMRFRLELVGLVGSDTSFDLPLKQAEIGDALGLSTVHVNRTLQTLRKEGLVSMSLGRVTILKPGLLAKLSSFNSQYLLGQPQRASYSKH